MFDLSKNLINHTPKGINNIPKIINQKDEIQKNINIEKQPQIKNVNKPVKNIINIKFNNKINNNISKRTILTKNKKTRINKPLVLFDFPPKKIITRANLKKMNNNKTLNSVKNSSIYNNTLSRNIIEKSKNDINKLNDKLINIQNIFNSELSLQLAKKEFDDYELNNLDYPMALKFDKRKFFEIYWSLLKREHSIIFTFFMRNDHNIIYIKYSRFVFLVCTDMALNVFFFADETMHKMFLDYGKYNIIQQIPQIIYSTIVSQMIQVFICYLSLTDKYYYQIKQLDIQLKYEILQIIKIIHLKILFFFIFTGIMFFFYWYTITCFCAVYANTQIPFIKDSLMSFGLGLFYPFALYLFPSALRIITLKYCTGKLAFIYKMSDIIPIF